MRARLLPLAVTVVTAAVIWLAFAPARFLNYDTEYSLLWGSDLARGHLPDLGVAFAPTPKPLGTLVGFLLALPGLGSVPRGGAQELIWEVFGFLALGALAWLTFALGRAWFGAAAGVVAAAVLLTREPVLSYGIRAYIDIPYMCLLLGALLVETRRRHAGAPVLVLIGLAGLLRPEAWLFALAYLAWLWRGGVLRRSHLALAAAAPLLWFGHDWALAGNPLHSLTGTREAADELQRVTGIANIPGTAPRRLGEILREPGILGAAGGVLLALWRMRDRALLGAGATVLALAAFVALAVAGLPLLTRYLHFPGALLAIFCGAGIAGWTKLAREDPGRRPWIALAVITVLMTIAFVPSQEHRLSNLRRAMITQTKILSELRDQFPKTIPASAGSCPITLPNRRAVPQVALWTGRPPGSIFSAQNEGRYLGIAISPVSDRVAKQFVLDRRDAEQQLPPPPAGPAAFEGAAWRVQLGRCSERDTGAEG